MLGGTRTARWTVVGFVVLASLVLLVLGWATEASLRLERATLQAQQKELASRARGEWEKNLAIVRHRMDNYILPVLFREAARSYEQYASYVLVLRPASRAGEPWNADFEPSPLLKLNLEGWIRLHFQVTSHASWSSPQLPSLRKWPQVADSSIYLNAQMMDRAGLLDHLARNYTPEEICRRMVAMSGTVAAGEKTCGANMNCGEPSPAQRCEARVVQLQKPLLPPAEQCAPDVQVRNVIGEEPVELREGQDLEYFTVRVYEMTPIWLPDPDRARPLLALVRRVEVGSDEQLLQGFIVDWPKLVQALEEQAGSLLTNVRLEPVLDECERNAPGHRLTALPVRLMSDAPQPPVLSATWSVTHFSIGLAWVTALIALLAIGLGVKSLLTLTERRAEFTYAVTHELRTPLTTFQLYTDMLSADLVPAEKKKQYLETLNREARRLAELVAEVLEFSRVENHAVCTRPRACTPDELSAEIRERYGDRCRACGLVLRLEAKGLGAQPLYTDPHIVLQIIGTLIDNACKYAAGSGPADPAEMDSGEAGTPAVDVSFREDGDRMVIEVCDRGPGIAPAERTDLFKPFRRGRHAEGSSAGGVGLGLALAKRWTRLLRGNLDLVDRPDHQGACFRLTFPVLS